MQATRLLSQRAASVVRYYKIDSGHNHGALQQLALQNFNRALTRPVPPLRAGRDLLKRIGKCLAFGCNPRQTADAAVLVRTVVNDWDRIEMIIRNCGTEEGLVYKQTLRAADETSLAASEPTWKLWGQRQQLSQVAVQAVTHLLNHAIATAAPAHKSIWHALRSGDTNSSPGGLAFTHADFNFGHVRLPLDIITASRAELGSHSAYTRLRSFKVFRNRACLSFGVFIRSNIHMAVVADGVIHATTNFNGATPDAIASLEEELDRVAGFQRDPATHNEARRRHAYILQAIQKLEDETWNRNDAVEYFGSASPA
ncbi:uncharacterized protein LY79DRAFT_592926 [Colletotrichum navitas]|uniref:Uncharacterized protein n=1 Tax=Colletotrichum navitas TaxID=681940 RepID=A0AAD8PSI2_9PEZI|nr:uncharacterized protein LY79DRAFT_592926 [Colletotrichum navitas]KAK1579284.1 hypothetical protein LY79DRAFT_592926 [Colletotrichum navitas]